MASVSGVAGQGLDSVSGVAGRGLEVGLSDEKDFLSIFSGLPMSRFK